MRILCWNVNGYRAALKKGFADWLAAERPDVLCIQETKSWAEQLTDEQRSPAGYHGLFSQPERKGYSGVATFSREAPASHSFGYGVPRFDAEGRVLLTRYEPPLTNGGDKAEPPLTPPLLRRGGKEELPLLRRGGSGQGFTLANIYFPNGKQNQTRLDYKMDFYEETLKFFVKLRDQRENLVVLGDYNTAHKPVDLARPKENEKISGFLPTEREWIDRWIDAGFVDIFRRFNQESEQYTWWDMRTGARERNIGWRIDYFFVNEEFADRIKRAWIMPEVMGSDHCPLGIEIG